MKMSTWYHHLIYPIKALKEETTKLFETGKTKGKKDPLEIAYFLHIRLLSYRQFTMPWNSAHSQMVMWHFETNLSRTGSFYSLQTGALIALSVCMNKQLILTIFVFAALWQARIEAAVFPKILDFKVKSTSINEANEFTAICSVQSLLSTIPIKINLMASDGVTIIERPRRLKGRLAPGKVAKFRVRCRRSLNTPRPYGLNFRLRYRLPLKALRNKLKGTQLIKLDEIAKAGTVKTMYRSALFHE